MLTHIPKLLILSITLLYITSTHSILVTPTNQQELDSLMQQEKPKLLQFTAEWCSACRRVKQTIEDVAREKEFDSIIIARIDTDRFGALATRYSVKSIPAFICVNSNGTTNITRTIMQNPLRVKDNLQSALRNITTFMPTEEKTTQEPVQQPASSPIAQLLAFLKYIAATITSSIHKIIEAIKHLFSK